MIHELTRDDLEFLLGDIEYTISDGYVVDGFPKEEIRQMSVMQLTWDNYDSKFCIIDNTKVCYKEVCHESYGIKCCLTCKKCNAWTSCPEVKK